MALIQQLRAAGGPPVQEVLLAGLVLAVERVHLRLSEIAQSMPDSGALDRLTLAVTDMGERLPRQ